MNEQDSGLEYTLPYRPRSIAELLTAFQLVSGKELKLVADGSPQQKAFVMGLRCALAWALHMPRGGKKLQQLMDGVPLIPVVGPLIGTEALDELGRRE